MRRVVQQYSMLVEQLYTATAKRLITWILVSENVVHCGLAGKTITITEGTNENFEPLFIVQIFAGENSPREQFDDEDLKSYGAPNVGSFSTYFGLISSLHKNAKRQATGADAILDSIIAELKSLQDVDDVPF